MEDSPRCYPRHLPSSPSLLVEVSHFFSSQSLRNQTISRRQTSFSWTNSGEVVVDVWIFVFRGGVTGLGLSSKFYQCFLTPSLKAYSLELSVYHRMYSSRAMMWRISFRNWAMSMWTATLDPGDLGHLAKPRLEVAEQGEFFWGPSLYCLHSE